jgi:peroxisomal 3,2-trans-enoyl-CoA isomerase
MMMDALYNSVVLHDHAKKIAVLCYFCLISGSGDYYCSGNDLSNFANVSPDSMADMAKQGGDILLYVIILSTLCLL